MEMAVRAGIHGRGSHVSPPGRSGFAGRSPVGDVHLSRYSGVDCHTKTSETEEAEWDGFVAERALTGE